MQAVENILWSAIIVVFFLALSGCGSGSDTPNISINNSNTASNVIDSQNGDTQCDYKCDPVQFDGGIGYLVTQSCNGNQNGPDFSPTCPSASAITPPAEAAPAPATASITPAPTLAQQGAL